MEWLIPKQMATLDRVRDPANESYHPAALQPFRWERVLKGMTKQTCRLGALLLLFAAFALSGCSTQRKIDGTWTATTTTSRAGVAMSNVQSYVFNPDNTMSIKQHVAMGLGAFDADEAGTYKLDGQSIDCTLTSAAVTTTSSFAGVTPAPKTVALNVVVDYTWALKDSHTLDLTMTSVTGGHASAVAVGKMVELTKQS
jgi:uncharacterized protein YceK